MTMRQFMAHLEAHQNREEAANRRAAMVAANIMNALGCKPRVTIERLLNPKRPTALREKEKREDKFAGLLRKVEAQRAAKGQRAIAPPPRGES